jgi:hypothetical protein
MIEYLHQIPGLEALEAIGESFDVDITAHGRVVRRAYTESLLRDRVPDLFDLTPFSTAIVLTHDGTPAQTKPILRTILEEVPLAECFRWRLSSRGDFGRDWADQTEYRPYFPVGELSISTRSGLNDRFAAHEDIVSGQLRFFGPTRYAPLFLPRVNPPAFAGIQYLEAVFDANLDAEAREQPGFNTVRQLFRGALTDGTTERLRGSSFFRGRLHYLLRNLGAAEPSADAATVIDSSGLRDFLTLVDFELQLSGDGRDVEPDQLTLEEIQRGEPGRASTRPGSFLADLGLDDRLAITSSKHLGGDVFRLPARVPFFSLSAYGDREIASALGWEPQEKGMLAGGVDAIRASSWIPVSGSTRERLNEDEPLNEMFHFAFIERELPGASAVYAPDEDLSMLLLVLTDDSSPMGMAAPLASCSSREYRNGQRVERVRRFSVACGSLMEQDLPGKPRHIAFTIAQRQGADDRRTPATTGRRQTVVPGGARNERIKQEEERVILPALVEEEVRA